MTQVSPEEDAVHIRGVDARSGACRVLPSSVLFAGKKEVRIHHAGDRKSVV